MIQQAFLMVAYLFLCFCTPLLDTGGETSWPAGAVHEQAQHHGGFLLRKSPVVSAYQWFIYLLLRGNPLNF